MPDLIAQGASPDERWRRPLPEGETVPLGRAAGEWSTPWDERISRQHVSLTWHAGRLDVEQLAGTKNPVFCRGRKQEKFALKPGEHFVIGATSFTLVQERALATLDAPRPVTERSFDATELRRAAFQRPDQRIAALARLPEIVSGSASDTELFVRLVSVLMSGITSAKGAALVRVSHPSEPVEVLQWDRRAIAGNDFHPSERLIRESVQRRESLVHVWNAAAGEHQADFTLSEGVDWAFCTPLAGECCRGWAIYATGVFPPDAPSGDPEWLRDDLKLAELVAYTFSSLREVQLLVRRQAGLSQFLSPVVMNLIGTSDPESVLAPREAEVSVLFCDLRGFTTRSEQQASDLLGLLNRVSEALGVMTRHILGHGGVIGDFHGDAAMGFWGWPLAQDDAALRACRAALAIRAEFEAATGERRSASSTWQSGDSPLADFRIGIGIASGRAVAGKIGTVDQVKVTVFGPVVNLASRLENMTKTLHAAILLDARSAAAARACLAPSEAQVRRMAKVRPLGMQAAIEVSELLPPAALSAEHIAAYETALDAILSGHWPQAAELLRSVPDTDEAKAFLASVVSQHLASPPAKWDGVIGLKEK